MLFHCASPIWPAFSCSGATFPPECLQCLSPHAALLQFLELSALVYKPCNYTRDTPAKNTVGGVPPFPSQCRVFLELSATLLRLPKCAARICGLSKFRCSFNYPVWPRLQSSEVHMSMHDRLCFTSFRCSATIPGTAAHVHTLSEADPKHLGPSRASSQRLVSCKDLRDTP